MQYNIDYRDLEIIDVMIINDVIDKLKESNYDAWSIKSDYFLKTYKNNNVNMFVIRDILDILDFSLKYEYGEIKTTLYSDILSINYNQRNKELIIVKQKYKDGCYKKLVDIKYNIKEISEK